MGPRTQSQKRKLRKGVSWPVFGIICLITLPTVLMDDENVFFLSEMVTGNLLATAQHHTVGVNNISRTKAQCPKEAPLPRLISCICIKLAPSQFARVRLPNDALPAGRRDSNLISLISSPMSTSLVRHLSHSCPVFDTPLVIVTLHPCYARFLSFIHSGR